MNRFAVGMLGLALVFSGVAAASVSVTPAQKSAICGKRTTCAVTAVHNAGAQNVAEIHLGLKDKADDAPDGGCIMDVNGDKKDGGTEYWLLGAKPVKVLALCNDGYGAAGVGEDTVTFGNNRMTHDQSGGSNSRGQETIVYSLAPFRPISSDGCSYNDTGPETGSETVTDEVNYKAVEIAKNPSAKWGDNDSMGCPDTKPAMFTHPTPYPMPKAVMAFPVIMPADNATFAVPPGTALGSCASVLSTDGNSGFVTFGKSAAANDAADVRLLAINNGETAIAQVYDPAPSKAAPGKSWIGGSHLEFWSGDLDNSSPLKRSDLSQVAVDLDGTVHAVGKAPAPKVTRWQAKDSKGRPVTVLHIQWGDADGFFVGAVSYSQSNNGKQVRLVANTPMEHGVPVYMPGYALVQGTCAVRGGRVEIR